MKSIKASLTNARYQISKLLAPTSQLASLAKTNLVVEERNYYKPGGFHPISPGDTFHDHYTILRKLDYGQYSTVWLARDSKYDFCRERIHKAD